MRIAGSIWDSITAQPVPGASVIIVDAGGSPTGKGTAADNNGAFVLDSTLLDQAGNQVQITSQGYQGILISPATLLTVGGVGLDTAADELQAAVITAKRKAPSSWMIIAGLGALALIIYMAERKTKKGRKIGLALSDKEWLDLSLKAGIALGVFFLVIKPILKTLGLLGDKNPDAAALQDSVDKSLKDLKANGGTQAEQTYTDTQYVTWANSIYNSGLQDPVDQSGIVNTVVNVNTTTDMLMLVKAFGTRKAATGTWNTCALLGFNCPEFDLSGYLHEVLDTQHLNNIIQYLSETGINYTL